jgi:hypothetical protein
MDRLRLMGAPMVLLLFVSHPASARHQHPNRHHHRYFAGQGAAGCVLTNDGRQVCGAATRPVFAQAIDANGNRVARAAEEGTIIGGRPDGCPHAYCGCGLRKYLGLSDKRLNLASNWARLFSHEAAPRPGLAAVRSGHVMYIESAAGNGQWVLRDYNSGGGLSRVHVRDLRGYVFVNPHG